jgi:hypothetical protein
MGDVDPPESRSIAIDFEAPMAIHAMDYRGIRVWHARGDSAGNWRELQKRAAREGAPIDALFLDGEKWIRAGDLPPDHEIHQALAQDRERCRRGFLRAAAAR